MFSRGDAGCDSARDRRVIEKLTKLFFLLLLFSGTPAVAGVDCTGSPHTRLEIAICGEPVLSAIDQELTDALTRAQQRGILGREDVRTQRNQIARQCWREADETLNVCLHNAELQALEQVVIQLGELDSSGVAEKNRDLNDRLREGLAHQKVLLQKQLMIAENGMRRTGNPELTVVTLFALIELNIRQQQLQPDDGGVSKADADRATAQIEQRLATGCGHDLYGRKWRRMVKRRDMSCDELQRAFPAQLSSAEDY